MQTIDWRNDVNRFDRALGELRREAPSEGIERIRAAMAGSAPSVWPRRMLAASIAVGAIAAFILIPRSPAVAAAVTFGDVEKAVESAPRFHSKWFNEKKGDRQNSMEQWRDGVRNRNHSWTPEGVLYTEKIYDGTRLWVRTVPLRQVTVRKMEYRQGYDANSLFEVIAQTQRSEKGKPVVPKTVRFEGKKMLEFTFDSRVPQRKAVVRARFYVDPDRKLPLALRYYLQKDGGAWNPTGGANFDYPSKPFPSSTFTLNLKPGERFINKDL